MRQHRTTYPHPCYHATCSRPTRDPYCPIHAPLYAARDAQRERARQDRRTPSRQRGYSAAWTRIRNDYIARHPSCRWCGRTATVVDHVVPLRFGGTHDEQNLQSLCDRCHYLKSKRERQRPGADDSM